MKPRIFDDGLLRELAARHGTPLYVYDTATIVARAGELQRGPHAGSGRFVVRYAQKANSNLALLRFLRTLGVLVDAVSAGELARARAAGFAPQEIVFCSDVFDRAALELLAREPIQASLGSPDMLEQLARTAPVRRDVILRINPGFGHGHHSKVTTGGEASKHGIWHADLAQVAERAARAGLTVSGLHVHVGSGAGVAQLERAIEPLVEHGRGLFGATLESLSVGGGLPIPYRAGEPRADLRGLFGRWEAGWAELERHLQRPLRFEVEPGRFLVAEAGVLLTEVRALKRSGSLEFVLVDAGFHNLIRPALYGAYHEISVVGRDGEACVPLVVAGPLCESSDVFTVDRDGAPQARALPRPRIGDLVCIHDAGAYAASMASNYNSQLLAAEILVHNGAARVVRARQSLEDLLRLELP